jgi:hypothetical protein
MKRQIERRLTPAMHKQKAFDFNAHVPVGSAVYVRKDNGDIQQTATRSEAWVMGGHTAVVLLEGVSGAYLLSRVTPVDIQKS